MKTTDQLEFIESAAENIKANGHREYNHTSQLKREAESFELVNNPKVLMYHRIVEDKEEARSQDTCLHIDDFHRQLELLNQLNYTPVTFEDYRLYLNNKLQLPQKPVILTFDDGYLDTYRLAYPLLHEYGMKAVIFVLGDRSIQTNIWDSKTNGISEAPLMKDEHVRELHAEGFEIGAHTLSHSNLKMMTEEECYREIHKSKIILEALLDSQVKSFSYPYGFVNESIKEMVFRAGYRSACSVYSGPAKFGVDPLEIRRIAVHNSTSIVGFAARLIAPYEYMEWLWWKTNGGQEDG